uniref:Uncharacterized protein n=1 Tax=Timspurckia oligopyrenoides TaxID=708627 RepID=A0A7S0ZBP8_9RHOD|mmetsp:Transcript_11552/g.20891  ORF Transcript_11552/g.20891 Transcript_11552/m.20891 type:complete len:163 (+) Transcript_11552:174-662(+)
MDEMEMFSFDIIFNEMIEQHFKVSEIQANTKEASKDGTKTESISLDSALESVQSDSFSPGKRKKNPSCYCHLCSRPAWRLPTVRCSNTSCSKAICEKCFEKYHWDFKHAVLNDEYRCHHCTDSCPNDSRCRVYQLKNAKRGEIRKNVAKLKKQQKVQTFDQQ